MVDKNHGVFKITKSLSTPIYEYLKRSIINNDLKAGERIDEKEVAKNFGVSRTPVREAIIRLSVEDFVDINYHRESVVKDIPYEGLEEILHVISHLDAYAITQVVDEISKRDLNQIESLTAKMGRCVSYDDTRKFFDTNFTLHEILWSYLPDGLLRSTLECGAAQIQRYSHKPHMTEAQIEKIQESSFAAHKKIMTALKNRDKETLSSLFAKHWIYPATTFLSQTK
jgi:DNA-binding GntR family transcriptional regulator